MRLTQVDGSLESAVPKDRSPAEHRRVAKSLSGPGETRSRSDHEDSRFARRLDEVFCRTLENEVSPDDYEPQRLWIGNDSLHSTFAQS